MLNSGFNFGGQIDNSSVPAVKATEDKVENNERDEKDIAGLSEADLAEMLYKKEQEIRSALPKRTYDFYAKEHQGKNENARENEEIRKIFLSDEKN